MKFSSKEWALLIGVSLASFIGNADFGIVNTAIPAIQNSLQMTFVQAQWIANAFALSLGIFLILAGKVADLLGRRRIFYVGITIFLLASAMAGAAPNASILIAARALLAIGSAIMFTSSGSLVAIGFGEQNRAKAMGIFWGIAMLGLAAGPILGGIITHFLNWRWVFFVNFPIALISIIICLITVPASANQRLDETVDWLGFIFFALFTLFINLGVIASTHIPMVIEHVVMYFGIAGLSLLLFFWRQFTYHHPLLPIQLFKQRGFAINSFITFAIGSFYGLAFFIYPFYLNNARGLSILNVGLFLLPCTVILAIISTYIGRFIDKGVSIKMLIVVGFLILAIACAGQLFFTDTTSLWYVSLPLILLGIGWGFITNPSSMIALEAGPENMSGIILGTIWTILNLGSSLAVAIGTALFNNHAESVLITDLTNKGLHFESLTWINSVISDPQHALTILQQHTGLDMSIIQTLFNDYFMTGYHHAVGYLLGMAIIVFFISWLGLPNKQEKEHHENPTTAL